MKIYANRKPSPNASNYERMKYYVYKLVGTDLWIKLSPGYDTFYYYQFKDIDENNRLPIYVECRDIQEDDGEIEVDRYRTTLEVLCKCYTIPEPVEIISEEEFAEYYLGSNHLTGDV